MGRNSVVSEVVRRGHRRVLSHFLLHHLTLAIAVAFAALILLLLLGTQVLNWYWLGIAFVAGFGLSAWTARTKVPSAYAVAQDVDSRLKLYDALSTAYFFEGQAEKAHAEPEVVARQRSIAEEIARGIDLRAGLPFAAPRSLYACAALGAAALGVFGLRYGVIRSLDLRPSLVQIAFDGIMGPREIADVHKKPPGVRAQKDQQIASGKDAPDSDQFDLTPNEPNPDKSDTPDVSNENNSQTLGDSKADGEKKGEEGQQQNSGDADADKDESAKPDSSGDKGKNENGSASKDDQENAGGNSDQQDSSGDNSSLMSKVKEAMSNLMSKLTNNQETPQGATMPSRNTSQPGQKPNSNQQPPNQPNGQAQPGASGDGNQQAQSKGAEKSQNEDHDKSSGKGSDNTTNEGSSGIGKSDGAKAAREAQQLAAMGKLSELIGKRSQNVTGEMMVEVNSSDNQQLKTKYSDNSVAHADTGARIDRDEIPLMYQQYVQQYFEQIHKPSTSKANSK